MNSEKDRKDFQFFSSLPSSLYYELRDFLEPRCYYRLVTTTRLLRPVLYETWIVKLMDPSELEVILSKIKNSRHQLVVPIDVVSQDRKTIQSLVDLPSYRITFGNYPVLNWEVISESHTRVHLSVKSVVKFPQRLSPNMQQLSIFCPGELVDVSPLSHLTKLSLINCRQVVNVNCLRNLSSLELYICSQVTDVSELGRIANLSIKECWEIVDISQLTNNRKLTMLDCFNIDPKTVPSFENAVSLETDLIKSSEQTLSLRWCRSLSIMDISTNFLIHTAVGSGLRRIALHGRMPPTLSDCSHLFIVWLHEIGRSVPMLELSPLFSVPLVHLQYFTKITTLAGLGGNRRVIVEDCPEIADFSALRTVHTVKIIKNRAISSGTGLENVFDLTLQRCFQLVNTTALRNVKHLWITECHNLTELSGLEDVVTVSACHCESLTDFHGLGNNQKIIVDQRRLKNLWKNSKLTLDNYEMTNPWNTALNSALLLKKKSISGETKDGVVLKS
jgi:hypothetical protein